MRFSGGRLGCLGLGLVLAFSGCGSPPVEPDASQPDASVGVDARVMLDSGGDRDSSTPDDGGPLPIECATGCLVDEVCFPEAC